MKRQVKVSVGRSAGYSVGESVGEAPPASTGTGLIDIYSGAVLAYSTGRRLRDAYTGALFRVRRSSDNVEQDIGFVAGTGIVDTAALTTFIGVNSGYVVTIYNQAIGGNFNATIGTASLQPAIVVASLVQTLGTNAYPAPLWDGPPLATGDDRLSADNVTMDNSEMSMWWACRDTDHTYYRAIAHYGTGAVGSGEFAIYSPDIDWGADNATFYNNSAASPSSAAVGATPTDYVGRVRGNLLSGSTKENIRVNKGTEVTSTTTPGANYGGAKNFHIGNRSDGIAGYAGVIGEILLYKSLTPAVTDGIDDSMMSFWGIS